MPQGLLPETVSLCTVDVCIVNFLISERAKRASSVIVHVN